MKEFMIRAVSLILIVAGIAGYNEVLTVREKDDTIARLSAELAEHAAGEKEAALDGSNGNGSYADGTYHGEAEGFGGTVAVDVNISGGRLTDIVVTSAEHEDGAYLAMAEGIIPKMIDAQSFEVDTISGATFSSTGIKTAVEEALKKAGKERE